MTTFYAFKIIMFKGETVPHARFLQLKYFNSNILIRIQFEKSNKCLKIKTYNYIQHRVPNSTYLLLFYTETYQMIYCCCIKSDSVFYTKKSFFKKYEHII